MLDAVRPGPQGIEVTDDTTLIIRLNGLRTLPQHAGHGVLWVVPQEAVAHYGAEWRRHPVGCGPFRFFHWAKVKLALQRHPHYHQRDEEGVRLPYLDAVMVGFVKDPNAEYLALVKGDWTGSVGRHDPRGRLPERTAGPARPGA